ncbi:MAG: hypothetical protein FWH05_06255 [Oscillospiraceae bacterium]|nr:hypothetical protein [Oscillospiraceae bacterium]
MVKTPNAATEAAMRECDEMLANGNYTTYNNAKELHAAILAEDDDVITKATASVT